MRRKEISPDDIQDVTEMTKKLEDAISKILADNEMDLAFSALVSATVNCMIGQCQTMEEVLFYKRIFIKLLNNSISQIKPQI